MDSSPPKKKILIVEDDASMERALADQFRREGFAVLEAKDGNSGLAVSLHQKPDIILLDILMPAADGLSMLKNLRQGSAYGKTVPVILLTNLEADNEVINRAITEYSPAYYLVKTEWTIQEVVEKVRERLEMK